VLARERRVGAERLVELLDAPDVELPLLSLAVGVEGGVEAARRIGHLAADPVERLLGHAPHLGVPRRLPQVHAEAREERVVVEHLLEVRDEPFRIHRVAVEAAAGLVVDPAARHVEEGVAGDLEREGSPGPAPVPEEEVEGHRLRELRRSLEAAVPGVVARRQPARGALEERSVERAARPQRLLLRGVKPPHLGRRPRDVAALRRPGIGDRRQHAPEGRHPVPVLRRVVGPAVEGLSLGREEHRHRPAAVPRHRLHGLHVDGVDVRPFLAVDLDVDEPLVHQARRLLVLEGLALHDVAPVAGSVADAEQDRLLLAPRPLERLVPPRIPVDRIVRVLAEVGGGFGGETVHGDRVSGIRGPAGDRGPGTGTLTVLLSHLPLSRAHGAASG
jgi:hypothetical protein